MMYNSFVFLLLITFLFPNVLKGEGKWKADNLPEQNTIKKIDVSPQRIFLGALDKNDELTIWDIQNNNTKILLETFSNIEDFSFLSKKDDIVCLKKRNSSTPQITHLKSGKNNKNNIILLEENELSSSTLSIDILSPSTPTTPSTPSSSQIAMQSDNNEEKSFWAVKEEWHHRFLIKIFDQNSLKQKNSLAKGEPKHVITKGTDITFFKFFLNKKFFIVLQKNGDLDIFDTNNWEKASLSASSVASLDFCSCDTSLILTFKTGKKTILNYVP